MNKYMSTYLSYDAPDQIKGNNPFQLSRMSVDPRFKSTGVGSSVAHIKGYSATGDIIYTDGSNSSVQPFMTTAQPDLMAKHRQPQGTVHAANDPAGTSNISSLSQKIQQLGQLTKEMASVDDYSQPKPKPEWMSFYGHKI